MTTTRTAAASAVAVALVLGLAGCTGAGGGASAASSAGERAPAAASVPETAADAAGTSGGSATKTAAAANRDIIRTGSLDLTTKDPVGVARRIGAIVTGAAGHLDADSEQPGHDPRADLTARIPASAFDATLTSIEATGTVRSLSLHESDVTAQVTDDGVRIKALEASVDRLTTLLGRASDTSDLVSLEGALTDREGDLQSLQAQQRGLADQVSYASLTIAVETPAAAPPPYRPGTFASGFAAGLAALSATVAWLAVAIGVVAPWVLVLAVLVALALATRRVVRRRRDGAAPGAHGAG